MEQYSKDEVELRDLIFEDIINLPTSSNDIMYQIVVNVATTLREHGIDLLTKRERKNVSNTARIVLTRYTRDFCIKTDETSVKKIDPQYKQLISDSILFLINIVDDAI
jgi:hypothetical protein